MNTPTPFESAPCWSDQPDPNCEPNQWLDRSGLIDVAASLPYGEATANHCVCRDLAPNCPDRTYWDLAVQECVCLEKCACAEHTYWNQNTCECECEENVYCPDIGALEYYWSKQDCSCKCVPAPETCVQTDSATGYWNTNTCSCECLEKEIDWCKNYGLSLDPPKPMYFNENACECQYIEIPCHEDQFWDQSKGECACVILGCPAGQYFNNVECACACYDQVCPEDYHFDNHSCSCVCLEPEGTCAALAVLNGIDFYWSIQFCECLCTPQPDACGENEYWENDMCGCACLPEECENPDMIWDMNECVCMCPPSGLCPHGTFYNSLTCSCEDEPMPCAEGQFWHSATSSCVCDVVDCNNDLKYFDFDACSCVFIQQDCPRDGNDPDPSFFDRDSGECICLHPNGCAGVTVEINDVTHPTFWNIETCECEPLPDACGSSLLYYDLSTGVCQCKNQVCGNNEIFDRDECLCKCAPEQCPIGFFWNEMNCSCDCMEPQVSCGEDFAWDNISCKCVCLEPPGAPCGDDHYWDNECCKCSCRPLADDVELPPGMEWDTRTCGF